MGNLSKNEPARALWSNTINDAFAISRDRYKAVWSPPGPAPTTQYSALRASFAVDGRPRLANVARHHSNVEAGTRASARRAPTASASASAVASDARRAQRPRARDDRMRPSRLARARACGRDVHDTDGRLDEWARTCEQLPVGRHMGKQYAGRGEGG